MSKHTPGPWRFNDNTKWWKTNPFSITVPRHGVYRAAIANIPAKATISRLEAEANARLISAAPDLLEALMTFPQSIAWTDDELWAWSKKAIDAIEKATGETA
jgi:hypothetical protein